MKSSEPSRQSARLKPPKAGKRTRRARALVTTYFEAHSRQVRVDQGLVDQELLREAQLGACGAVVAHASRSEDPAQIVMPTGVGKSLVLTAAPFLLGATKVLVVAPARLVRDQLTTGFRSLQQLRDAGMASAKLKGPKVEVARRRASENDWERWQKADVVVGTVNVLSDGYPEVTRIPRDMFDLVLFDEAHHLPARTWSSLLEAVDARALLFTATPFRRDGKRLPGEIAFDYPLARAIERGVYAPVSFVPVHPEATDDKDDVIARAASQRLRSKEHADADSRLLVRTDRVDEAKRLVDRYTALDLPIGLIEGGTSGRAADKILERVRNGELHGFACVGALIEGFDFPTLTVAAYHVPHRSLAPTLQFIGRLSRATSVRGELVADPRDLSRDTGSLYRSETAWEELLPALVDSAVDEEKATRRFIKEASTKGDGADVVPWLAVSPSRSVQVYELSGDPDPDLDLNVQTLGGAEVVQSLYQPENDLFTAMTQELQRPRFVRTTHLDGIRYRLHTATWVKEHGLLFISSDRPSALKELRELLGASASPLIGSESLRRLLDSGESSRFFSVGLRESRPRQASLASYETKAGRSADRAIGNDDTENKLLGHAMGRTAEGGFGVSTGKGKYWQPKAAENLFEFRQWCVGCAATIRAQRKRKAAAAGAEGAMGRLRIADHLSEFPDHPLAAVLSETLLDGEREFVVGSRRVHPVDADVEVVRVDSRTLRLTLYEDEQPLAAAVQDVTGSTEVTQPARLVDVETGEFEPLDAVFEEWPPIVFFGDGSMTEGGKGARLTTETTGPVPDYVLGVDWSGIDTAVEVGTPESGKGSIHSGTLARLEEGADWVIGDHGTGELADFIRISQEDGDTIHATLVHCKGSRKAPGGRVDDLYEVLGQAIRSARWCRPGPLIWAELERRLAERELTRLLAGDKDELATHLSRWGTNQAPLTRFEVTVVQPGLLREATGSRANVHTLVRAVAAYFHDQDAEFGIWCNDQ
jgi:superfamily II DNA or RNA helicase